MVVCLLVGSFISCTSILYSYNLCLTAVIYENLFVFIQLQCFCFPCCGMFSFFVFLLIIAVVQSTSSLYAVVVDVTLLLLCCCYCVFFVIYVSVCVRVSFCFCNFYQSHKSCTHIVSLSRSLSIPISLSLAHTIHALPQLSECGERRRMRNLYIRSLQNM